MTRYQVLRYIGCDPLTAGAIAFLNRMFDVPPGVVGFLFLVIEFDPTEEL